jgi:hypothetical protein
MIWAVSLLTTKLSPRRLTHAPLVGIRSLLGVGNQHLAPSPCSALPPTSFFAWLHLNAFRGEPAISTFAWHFTPTHRSSPSFATLVSASLDGLSHPLHSAHG